MLGNMAYFNTISLNLPKLYLVRPPHLAYHPEMLRILDKDTSRNGAANSMQGETS
jgi:hypothetical protein